MPLMLPSPDSSERTKTVPVNSLRRQALARLYRRRETVENLIRSLENYEQAQTGHRMNCVSITAGRKCS